MHMSSKWLSKGGGIQWCPLSLLGTISCFCWSQEMSACVPGDILPGALVMEAWQKMAEDTLVDVELQLTLRCPSHLDTDLAPHLQEVG